MTCSFIKTFPAHLAVFLKFLPKCCRHPPATPRANQTSAPRSTSALSVIIHSRSPSEIIASGDQWIMRRQLLVLLTLSHPGGFWGREAERVGWLAEPSGSCDQPVTCLPFWARSPAENQKQRETERQRDRERERVGEQNSCLSCIYVESVVHRWKM